MFQTVFKRYELKYILTVEQKKRILEVMKCYMQPDQYGKTSIRNLYFDTDTYLLIRRSIEKPEYKEKLRVRSYGETSKESLVCVELKKKYRSVVYKRREVLPYQEAMTWIETKHTGRTDSQISNEINYCLEHYETLHPTMFLSYEREAFYEKDNADFRVTFDDTILARDTELSLVTQVYGTSILPEGMVLMEIKCAGAIPLWMTDILSREKIYKTSFSKYGTAYRTLIFPKLYPESRLIDKGENSNGEFI